ncbi:MAG: alanine racemase [Patescibacteria group bacterium]
MSFRTVLRKIRRKLTGYTPLIEVGISKENLLHNLHTYQERYPGITFAPVLKSNAYGHDIGTVARLLDRERIAFFVVDSYYEALRLRRHGIRSRILVMGYVRPEDIARSRLPHVDFTLVDLAQVQKVASLARRPIRVHLKLDTGMHRQGITLSELSYAEDALKGQPLLELVGVCSHFADADGKDETVTTSQTKVWKEGVSELMSAFPTLTEKHIAATKGVRFATETDTNIVRLGIGLYGFDTSPAQGAPLKPVLEVRSLISSLRIVPEGDKIGYNATYTTGSDMKVATVPVGYYEGIDRRLSNKGSMLVKGIICPIVGRVSMNMTSIDVSNVPNVTIGDPVVAISRVPTDANSVSNIASTVSTSEYKETEYVVLTHIASHLERHAE